MTTETRKLAELIHQHIRMDSNWIDTQSSEASYARNQPGSSGGPHYTYEDKVLSTVRALNAVPLVEFDPTYVSQYVALCKEVGLDARMPHSHFPFQTHAEDPEIRGYGSSRFSVFFRPDGSFYAAHDQKYGVHIRNAESGNTPGEDFKILLFIIRQIWFRVQQERRAELVAYNAQRAKYNLPLFISWEHSKNPSSYKFKDVS